MFAVMRDCLRRSIHCLPRPNAAGSSVASANSRPSVVPNEEAAAPPRDAPPSPVIACFPATKAPPVRAAVKRRPLLVPVKKCIILPILEVGAAVPPPCRIDGNTFPPTRVPWALL